MDYTAAEHTMWMQTRKHDLEARWNQLVVEIDLLDHAIAALVAAGRTDDQVAGDRRQLEELQAQQTAAAAAHAALSTRIGQPATLGV